MRVPTAFFRILFCSLFTRHLHKAVYSELLKASFRYKINLKNKWDKGRGSYIRSTVRAFWCDV